MADNQGRGEERERDGTGYTPVYWSPQLDTCEYFVWVGRLNFCFSMWLASFFLSGSPKVAVPRCSQLTMNIYLPVPHNHSSRTKSVSLVLHIHTLTISTTVHKLRDTEFRRRVLRAVLLCNIFQGLGNRYKKTYKVYCCSGEPCLSPVYPVLPSASCYELVCNSLKAP